MARRPAVSMITTSRPSRRASSRAERVTFVAVRAVSRPRKRRRPSSGACAQTGTSRRRPRICSCSTAAGRCQSPATSNGRCPLRRMYAASLALVVALPEPCRPTIRYTLGGALAMRSGTDFSPTVRTSSSWTILTTCWPGPSALLTSAPTARSRIRPTRSLATRKLTSASSRARRISRRAVSTSAAERRPLPRSPLKIPLRRLESPSNIAGTISSRAGGVGGTSAAPQPIKLRPSPRMSAQHTQLGERAARGAARSAQVRRRPMPRSGEPGSPRSSHTRRHSSEVAQASATI